MHEDFSDIVVIYACVSFNIEVTKYITRYMYFCFKLKNNNKD